MTYPEFISEYCKDIIFKQHREESPCVDLEHSDMTTEIKRKIIMGGWNIYYTPGKGHLYKIRIRKRIS